MGKYQLIEICTTTTKTKKQKHHRHPPFGEREREEKNIVNGEQSVKTKIY